MQHSFVGKPQELPVQEIEVARRRMMKVKRANP